MQEVAAVNRIDKSPPITAITPRKLSTPGSVACLLLLAVVSLSGCSGGGDDGGSATQGLAGVVPGPCESTAAPLACTKISAENGKPSKASLDYNAQDGGAYCAQIDQLSEKPDRLTSIQAEQDDGVSVFSPDDFSQNSPVTMSSYFTSRPGNRTIDVTASGTKRGEAMLCVYAVGGELPPAGHEDGPRPDDGITPSPKQWQPGLVASKTHEGGAELTIVHPNVTSLTTAEFGVVTVDIVENYTDDNPYGADVLGFAFDIGPDGQNNDPPLIATIRWPEGSVTDEEANHLRVFLKDEATGKWEAMPVYERSLEGRYLRVPVRHHSLLTLIVPYVFEPLVTYVAKKGVEYATNVIDQVYGELPDENPFVGLSDSNNVNYVNQCVAAGFSGCSTADCGFNVQRHVENAMGSAKRWFYAAPYEYSDTWFSPIAFNEMLVDGYAQTSGLVFKFIECDTQSEFLDYTQVQVGDVITGDFPHDLVPDPNFTPDGFVDLVFYVGDIQTWRWGYNEVRLWYQDGEGHGDVGLGTINDEFHKKAIFCVWRPVDYSPAGPTDLAPSSPSTTSEDRGYPGKQVCEKCGGIKNADGGINVAASLADCQEMADSIVELFPDFRQENAEVVVSTHNDVWYDSDGKAHPNRYCWFAGDDSLGRKKVECHQDWVNNGTLTNKTLFHEISHGMRGSRKLVGGASGICSNGTCGSSEFQASIHEALYYPPEGECTGGHYRFTDSAVNTRLPEETLEILLEEPAITEKELWDYVIGRKDTIVNYLDRFDLPSSDADPATTSDLYRSQTYRF